LDSLHEVVVIDFIECGGGDWVITAIHARFTCACVSTSTHAFIRMHAFIRAGVWFEKHETASMALQLIVRLPPFAFRRSSAVQDYLCSTNDKGGPGVNLKERGLGIEDEAPDFRKVGIGGRVGGWVGGWMGGRVGG
jgi:hypothetical protein